MLSRYYIVIYIHYISVVLLGMIGMLSCYVISHDHNINNTNATTYNTNTNTDTTTTHNNNNNNNNNTTTTTTTTNDNNDIACASPRFRSISSAACIL